MDMFNKPPHNAPHNNRSSQNRDDRSADLLVVISIILVFVCVAAGTVMFNTQGNASALTLADKGIAVAPTHPSVQIYERPAYKAQLNFFSDAENISRAVVDGLLTTATLAQDISLQIGGFVSDTWKSGSIANAAIDSWQTLSKTIRDVDEHLVNMKNMIRPAEDTFDIASAMNEIEPSAGKDAPAIASVEEPTTEGLVYEPYLIEAPTLDTEGVLVPKEKTVISSSRDGKIQSINFDNGDTFKKGDVLLEYTCTDAKSEAQIADLEQDFRKQELDTTMRLLKLDLISKVEEKKAITEAGKAGARLDLYQSKVEDCYIRATYNGRVIKRIASPHEYTRTDRVLLEVASDDDLDIEFLAPSKWLRWLNVGAPFTVELNETGRIYSGQITRIYGEVDPVSQSIQVRGSLLPYQDRLLPGMSGGIAINVSDIKNAGIIGYLEQPRQE